jgi:hypothetical protein
MLKKIPEEIEQLKKKEQDFKDSIDVIIIPDRFKLGIKIYGYDSEFRKSYESMTQQLRHSELDEFFNKWGIPQK